MIGQRISAGGIVVQNNKVLLVHHCEENGSDYWVLPGGGIEGDEGILKVAEREVWEETNLAVTAERIAYVEEFIDGGKYVCKFWVYYRLEDATFNIEHKDASEDHLKGARFFSKEELQAMNVFSASYEKYLLARFRSWISGNQVFMVVEKNGDEDCYRCHWRK